MGNSAWERFRTSAPFSYQALPDQNPQASGKTGPALALSVSRQGVVFAAALFVCIRLWGYHGIVAAQLLADCLSALLALALLRLTFRTDPVLGRGETNC